jgi:hypothetical protein
MLSSWWFWVLLVLGLVMLAGGLAYMAMNGQMGG